MDDSIDLENYVMVQWSAEIDGVRLATCAACGFENDSPFKHTESHCGACGEILINGCENLECTLYGHPLTKSYRFCGRCGSMTSWARFEQMRNNGNIVEPDLPDDLSF